MNTYSVNPAAAASLTEAELFDRMLDAPVHSALSLLNKTQNGGRSLQEALGGYSDACGLDHDQIDQILSALRECDAPGFELENTISELERVTDDLKTVQREFEALRESTVVDDPACDTPDRRPRYLPTGKAA